MRAVIGALLTALALGSAAWAVGQRPADPRPPLLAALEAMPRSTHTVSFVDWQYARTAAGHDRLTRTADRRAVVQFAGEHDLAGRSVLASRHREVLEIFGWSVADLGSEVYGQSDEGALLVLGFGRHMTWSWFSESLEELGYRRSGAVWSLSADAFARAAPGAPMQLMNLASVPRLGLVIASDHPDYVRRGLEALAGAERSVADDRAVAAAAAAVGPMASGVVRRREPACASTDLARLTAAEASLARERLEGSGPLRAYRAMASGRRGGAMVFALSFADGTDAAHQLGVREALFSGDVIGQSGSFEDRMRWRAARTVGASAVFEFTVQPDAGRVLTDLDDGPLLPMACPTSL